MFLFDFDGVLMNSLKEAGLSAYNAMHDTLHTSLDKLPENCIELFIKNVHHFHNPYTLCILMKWCAENSNKTPNRILTRQEFKVYADALNINSKEISPYFYSIRVKFMESSPDEWLRLNSPYETIWQALLKKNPQELVILTAKNRKAVLKLCHHYGLMIPDENIYSGDNNLLKTDNYLTIKNRFPNQKFNFIDDHIGNLKDLHNAFNKANNKELNLILCDWGYGDKADFSEARDLGFEVLSQEEVVSRL